MLTKSDKLWIKSLQNKEVRYEDKVFVAEGQKLVLELLKDQKSELVILVATEDFLLQNSSLFDEYGDLCKIISKSYMDNIATLKTNKTVVAIFKMPIFLNNNGLNDGEFILYLDQIQDPGNMGTILRSADWFGLTQIYCSHNCVDPFNNKSVQASMSSVLRVNVKLFEWEDMCTAFVNLPKYATALNASPYHQYQKADVCFLSIGNEARGLSKTILNSSDHLISIPSKNNTGAESLNAAIATSILLAWKFCY